MIFEGTITLDTDHGVLEDVPASYYSETSTYIREPFSTGQGRGIAYERGPCTLHDVKLGALHLSREQVVAWIGEAEVCRQELLMDERLKDPVQHLDAAE